MGSHKSLRRICELGWAVIQRGKTSSGKGHLEINVTALGFLWIQSILDVEPAATWGEKVGRTIKITRPQSITLRP
jgi:hypothetical protein